MKVYTFSPGGIHPPQQKNTAGTPVIPVSTPDTIVLPLDQHIGRTAEPVVSRGETVGAGQLIARVADGISAAIHTPLSGTVTEIGMKRNYSGIPVRSVTIRVEEGQSVEDVGMPMADIGHATAVEIVAAASAAGLVGLGGAAFPTAFKIHVPEDNAIDTVVINGAECEPVLTCDDALMCGHPGEVVAGARLVMKATGAKKAIIGVEDNKPEAIARLREAAAPYAGSVTVAVLKAKYPQGGERQLVQALTGRIITPGKLPMSVGVVVQNVATARALYRAVAFGEPLTKRIVTVAGAGIARPADYLVPVGMSISALLQQAGADMERIDKLVAGGPMMGHAIETVDAPVTKALSAVVAFSGQEAYRRSMDPCVRCGRCVDVCPNALEPYLIATCGKLGRVDDAARAGAMMCMECGSCSYVCPSSRPITDMIRVAKYLIRKSLK